MNPSPSLTVTSSSSLICPGQSASLTANGASTYSWSNTTSTTSVIAISPTLTTTYSVTGTSLNGCKSTLTVTQNVSACTGIESLNNSVTNAIHVYPNPSNGLFTIDVPTITTITIVDALGKVVYSQRLKEGEHLISMQDVKSGIYVLKANSNDQTKIIKLIKE